MDLIEKLEAAVQKARASGVADSDLFGKVKKLIHSPLLALLVKLSPTTADDAVLDILRSLFPLAA